MTRNREYSSRSAAVRAARRACRRALNAPYFQASEGHDYIIYPCNGEWYAGRSVYELRGPALDACKARGC